MSKIQLSIIIPVYNEEKNLPIIYERLLKVVAALGVSYQFIFINDGSVDDSINIIKTFSKENQNVKYIDFSRNFGHQVAVTAGLDICEGDATVIIDADLQDPPELIIELYQKMLEGFNVVYARRRIRKGESFLKKLTAKVFYRLMDRITTVRIPLDTGDFRIIDRKIINTLKNMPEQQKYLRGQIAWAGFKQTFVEYDRDERLLGKTGYTYSKMLRFAFDGITSFSNFPLKFASFLGFTFSGISFILILFALYEKIILHNTVRGWTSLILVVLFLGGIQLLSIGIIGEYIGRISANIRNRPLYVVNETNIEELNNKNN
jgi:glycosyltransferase involved in cell wall biosynthesis